MKKITKEEKEKIIFHYEDSRTHLFMMIGAIIAIFSITLDNYKNILIITCIVVLLGYLMTYIYFRNKAVKLFK